MTARVAEIADARLRGLPGYRPGRSSTGQPAGKLSSNESPLGTAPAARAALAAAAASAAVSHYPDEQQARRLLAEHAGVEPSWIMLTNGSDEFCYLLANVFLGAGRRVAVLGDPPYQIDATASLLAGATLRRVPLQGAGPRRGAHDLAAMAAAAADAALVWLPSPHNPTGAAAGPAELVAFLDEVPDDCLVVLDEAYRAFADPDLRPDIGELLARHPNLVVQRTLSKDWGLAGLRAGYALADPELIASLARARPPFSVNALALAAIVGSVGSRAWRSMVVARVREQRSVLQAELARLGIEHFPSQANFVTARLDPGAVARVLDGSGLVVRPGDDLGLPGWVRISIGWAPQMAVLRRALRDLAHLAYSVPARSRSAPARPRPHAANGARPTVLSSGGRPPQTPPIKKERTMQPNPIRRIGSWADMGPEQRRRAVTRGLDKIFDPGLREDIARLIEDVRVNGDAALVRALKTFDGCEVEASRLRVTEAEFAAARASVSPALRDAIRDGIDHVRRFNEQITARGDWSFESEPGLIVGEKVTPIESAGLFVPSGKASYPSVLIQLGTPAVVAGVPEIAVIVPPVPGSDGEVDSALLVAAGELGLTNVYRSNGPAGIAALAFGTETVPRVRKVVGPGSPAVTCAQIEVQRHGTVTNMLLGPSESLIIADDSADPRLLAADLLNEAEHGADSSSLLVTDSEPLLARAQEEVSRQLDDLPEPRRGYAATALGENGGAVLVRDMAEAAEVANSYAPEHMQIAVRDEDGLLARLSNAGEILVGQWTPVSAANFIIGCPASLPTSGFAVVSSGITADAFRKRTAVARADRRALRRMSDSIIAFTQHEGFPAHEAAVRIRLEDAGQAQ